MDFLTALKKRKTEGIFPVITDIKCFSPKEGDLMCGRDPAAVAMELEAAGACFLSVVTEPREFHGSMEILRDICASVRVPVLRKDFVKTEADLIRTKEAGASAILLMYSCLEKGLLESLYAKALEIGLVPFVETHTAQELQWAGELGAELVGINNRNILELERDDGDVSTSENLMRFRPENAFLVVESGLQSGADVRRAARCGADAVLVGTAILRDPVPAAMYRAMTRPCDLKICGLMDREGILLCRKHHVDVLGFVTEYPVSVPWNLDRKDAAELIRFARQPLCDSDHPVIAGEAAPVISGSADHAVPVPAAPLEKICIVTGGSPEKVITLARELHPDYVQLHYTETAAETAQITQALHAEGILVIRSIPSDAKQRIHMFGTSDPAEIAGQMRLASVDALLLDSRDAGNAAAGGGSVLTHVQKDTFEQMRSSFGGQIILGGGLTAANIGEAVRTFLPDMADVMTGVETAPGKKSDSLLAALTEALD